MMFSAQAEAYDKLHERNLPDDALGLAKIPVICDVDNGHDALFDKVLLDPARARDLSIHDLGTCLVICRHNRPDT